MAITAGLTKFQTFDNNGAAVAVTFTGTTTDGSTISVGICWSPTVATLNADPVLTGGGLTWNKRVSARQDVAGGNAVGVVFWDAINVDAVTNLVLLFVMGAPHATGNYGNVSVVEIKSSDTTAPFENSNSGGAASGTDPTMATGSASNTTTDGFAHVMAAIDAGVNPCILTDPPTGYTSIGLQADATAHQSGQASYKVLTSAGANSASWATDNAGSTGGWAAAIVVYKGIGEGGGATLPATRQTLSGVGF